MGVVIILCSFALVVALAALVRASLDHFVLTRRMRELSSKVELAHRLTVQRGNLASEVAHEIKNPITAILCSAETLDLLLGDDLPPDHRQSLRYIKEYGDHLLRLVSDFLDVSRAESGSIVARAEVVKICPVVETVLGLLRASAERKKISITCEEFSEDLTVEVDPRHLRQIFFNLLHNAIKFTPEKGKIIVRAKHTPESPFVALEVTDTGLGIPETELARIFDVYARYEGNQPLHDAGTGLGLTLCKALIELAEGSIAVQSTPGLGTTFTVTFRRPQSTGSSLTTQLLSKSGAFYAAMSGDKPLHGQRFLVVDQDTGTRESISRLIGAWGGMVDQVGQAMEAVEALTKFEYDAVMIDDTADGLPGTEVVKLLRHECQTAETTLILASTRSVDENQVREAGADKFVEKPLNGKTLLNSLLNSGKYNVTH